MKKSNINALVEAGVEATVKTTYREAKFAGINLDGGTVAVKGSKVSETVQFKAGKDADITEQESFSQKAKAVASGFLSQDNTVVKGVGARLNKRTGNVQFSVRAEVLTKSNLLERRMALVAVANPAAVEKFLAAHSK